RRGARYSHRGAARARGSGARGRRAGIDRDGARLGLKPAIGERRKRLWRTAMKRSLPYLLAAAPLLLSALAHARDLPNVNVYYAAKPVRAALPGSPPPAFASSFDDRRGVPTFLWASRPSASPGASSLVSISPEEAARAHLLQHGSRYGAGAEAISTA